MPVCLAKQPSIPVSLAIVQEINPDITEQDAYQVLHLLHLSEQQGYSINHSMIERIIDRVIFPF
jgi:hypothetical protein